MYDGSMGPRPLPDGERPHRHSYSCSCGKSVAPGATALAAAIVWVVSATLLFVAVACAWWCVRTVGAWAF